MHLCAAFIPPSLLPGKRREAASGWKRREERGSEWLGRGERGQVAGERRKGASGWGEAAVLGTSQDGLLSQESAAQPAERADLSSVLSLYQEGVIAQLAGTAEGQTGVHY